MKYINSAQQHDPSACFFFFVLVGDSSWNYFFFFSVYAFVPFATILAGLFYSFGYILVKFYAT